MIRVILANASIECELSDLSAVMATVNPGKTPEPAPEVSSAEFSAMVKSKIEDMGTGQKVKILTCAETFASWNIGDISGPKMRQAWFGSSGPGVVKVGTQMYPGGFFGFLFFLRTRNPGRTATREQLWQLFRFMPWAESTFV